MKKILNTTILFFVLVLSFAFSIFAGTAEFQLQSIDIANCIKNIKKETFVLVSNKGVNGEISSRQNKKNNNITNSSSIILIQQTENNLFSNNNIQINTLVAQDLSNNKQKAHHIRAP